MSCCEVVAGQYAQPRFGQIAGEMQKQPWGDEFGTVVDSFGITWFVNIRQPQP